MDKINYLPLYLVLFILLILAFILSFLVFVFYADIYDFITGGNQVINTALEIVSGYLYS